MVVEYNTEKKHTEYKIIVEDGRVSKIIVQIPKNEDVEEEEYEINSDTLQEGVTRRICYKTFKKYGFTWGGEWNSLKDYQHFEKRM